MGELVQFEGPVWRPGDGRPTVLVGGVQRDGERFYGEIDLPAAVAARARMAPKGWKLRPKDGMLLNVELKHMGGNTFSFHGTLNVERFVLTFARRQNGTFDFFPAGMGGIAMPQDCLYISIVGNEQIAPPKEKMNQQEINDWVASLKANGYRLSGQDALGQPINT